MEFINVVVYRKKILEEWSDFGCKRSSKEMIFAGSALLLIEVNV